MKSSLQSQRLSTLAVRANRPENDRLSAAIEVRSPFANERSFPRAVDFSTTKSISFRNSSTYAPQRVVYYQNKNCLTTVSFTYLVLSSTASFGTLRR